MRTNCNKCFSEKDAYLLLNEKCKNCKSPDRISPVKSDITSNHCLKYIR